MQALAIILATLNVIISALVSWTISRIVLRENVARELLSEALAIQALEESWIVQSDLKPGVPVRVSDYPDLKEEPVDGSRNSHMLVWLKRVEIRAVLDEAHWNSPTNEPYGFVGTRRAWIVRNEVGQKRHPGPTQNNYPALVSSRGREELCGWIERVRKAHDGPPPLRTLSKADLEMLRPLLRRLADEDIIENLKDGLTSKSIRFLSKIRTRWL